MFEFTQFCNKSSGRNSLKHSENFSNYFHRFPEETDQLYKLKLNSAEEHFMPKIEFRVL